ncbi:MAG TPA: SprB repeat-containing protein, partial [Flavobacterium sp.]|nr:SprB repeat-containing protein [Flavobacterium sp.]
ASEGVTLTTAPSLALQLVSTTPVNCGGGNDGAFRVRSTGGTRPYRYSIDNGQTFQFDSLFTTLAAGIYSVMVTDSNNCSESINVTIVEPPPLVLSLLFTTPVSCNGLDDGFMVVLASGGNAPYLYSMVGGPQNQTSGAFDDLPAGVYKIIVTDFKGCLDTLDVTVSEPNLLAVMQISSTNASCVGINNGSLTVGGSGGTLPYEFSLNGGPYQSSAVFSNMAAGNYLVAIRDDNGCQDADSMSVGVNVSINASIVKIDVLCNGDSTGNIIVNASGGTPPFNYSLNNGLPQTSNSFANLTAGNYFVIVEDQNGCRRTLTTNITEPAPISIKEISNTPATCSNTSNGAVSMNVSGGVPPYNFSWTGGFTTQNLSNIPGGNYVLTVTDANGCTETEAVIISAPSVLFANVILQKNVSCSGANDGEIIIGLNGGTPPFVFNWTNGATTQGNTGLAAGVHGLTVTEGNNCTIDFT